MKSKKYLPLCTTSLLLILGGCANLTDSTSPLELAGELSASPIDINNAISLALNEVPGHVVEVEFDKSEDAGVDNSLVWEIEIQDDQLRVVDLVLNANSGSIIDKHIDEGSQSGLNMDQFVKVEQILSGTLFDDNDTVIAVELNYDGSTPLWSVISVANNTTVNTLNINALTGNIVP